MEADNKTEYWDQRGSLSYKYRGEVFYTVTPIPFYYKRRELLLGMMQPYFDNPNVTRVCDFGCGDGWYLKHFSNNYEGKQWYGVDLSQIMIERAKDICPSAQLQVSGDGILFNQLFDIVYSIAVFAHVLDDTKMKELFSNIQSKLQQNGSFIMFEQTGRTRQSGETWCRRNTSEYVSLAEQCGLVLEKRVLIAFPVHRVFEKKVYPLYIRFFRNANMTERCIRANRSPVFRLLSSTALALSGPPIRQDDGTIDGNTLYLFRKAN